MKKNIKKFINECAENIKETQSHSFISKLELFHDEGYGYWDRGIKSPIEQILFASLLHDININNIYMAEPESIGNFDVIFGINIEPQVKVGKYRIDFKVENVKTIFDIEKKKVIANSSKVVFVECDSQQWHERTETERRYEKARDRYFIKHNIKIFHYTGKEIIDNPLGVSSEILKEVLGYTCLYSKEIKNA